MSRGFVKKVEIFLLRGHYPDGKLPGVLADLRTAAVFQFPGNHHAGDPVLDLGGYGAAERTCAHSAFAAYLAADVAYRVVREAEGDPTLHRALSQLPQEYAADTFQLFLAQAAEYYNVVDTVDQLRTELLFQRGHHVGFAVVLSAAESQCIPGKLLRADVSGHYHDCAAEIRRPAVGGGQRALLKYLQKQVEHVRVRLFHLIEQYHGVGGAAHALYQLTLLLVAHISGRGAYQLGYGVASP